MDRPVSLQSSLSQTAATILSHRHGRKLLVVRFLWLALAGLSLLLLVFAIPARLAQLPRLSPPEVEALDQLGLSARFYTAYFFTLDLVYILGTLAVGLTIALRRSRAWLPLLVSAMLVSGAVVGNPLFLHALLMQAPAWWVPVTLLRGVAGGCVLAFAYLFPNSRFVPRRVWVLLIGWAGWSLSWFFWADADPYRLLESGSRSLHLWPFLLALAFGGSGLVAQMHRYRHMSNQVQRQQTRWVAFGLSLALLAHFAFFSSFALFPTLRQPDAGTMLYSLLGIPILALCLLLVPMSIAFTVFHTGLWDAPPLLNRAFVYSSVSALILVLYGLVVGTLGVLFPAQDSVLRSLLAVALIAVLLHPLRQQLQHRVAWILYGEATNPLAALSCLGQRLEEVVAPAELLPCLVETVAETFRLSYTAVAYREGEVFPVVAATGQPTPWTTWLPLVYQGEIIGRLIVSPPRAEEDFSPTEQALLEGIARQASAAVHAVRLTSALQLARQHLVAAREEERRRLRRDLHDGLGPMLASQGLKLAASQQLLQRDPDSAAVLLQDVLTKNEAAVSEIRRLVNGLQPPALNELGLVGAIREYAASANCGALLHTGLRVQVEAPAAGLPPLPAAVEVAAYRIASEALTNVTRHAGARHCLVSLALADGGGYLHLTVSDDGAGLPATFKPGLGLHSMRERAEELGGTFQIESLPEGGVHVATKLPLSAEG